MIPAETSTTTSGSTHHHLRGSLRSIHQRLNAKGNPPAGKPSPATKGRGVILCGRFCRERRRLADQGALPEYESVIGLWPWP